MRRTSFILISSIDRDIENGFIMKLKRKNIVMGCLMCVLAVFLFVSVNLLFMPKYIEHDQDGSITSEFYREQLNNDVIFVGSSTVFSGVNPIVLWEQYGMTAYDRSNSSQTSWISYFVLKDALERSEPEMVVLDLGFFRYGDDYVEEANNRKTFDGMRPSKTKFQGIRAARDAEETYLDYAVPIFRFHTRWKDLKAEDFKYMYYKPSVTHNGYIYLDGIVPPDREPNTEGLFEVRMSNRNAMFLENIIELCMDHSVPLLLMKTPSYDPKWGEEFEKDIHDIADGYGVPYVDFDTYAEEMGLDYTVDTGDGGGHLNVTGAEKFTTFLGGYLKENYTITDHRNDLAYTVVWQEKCERFHNGH